MRNHSFSNAIFENWPSVCAYAHIHLKRPDASSRPPQILIELHIDLIFVKPVPIKWLCKKIHIFIPICTFFMPSMIGVADCFAKLFVSENTANILWRTCSLPFHAHERNLKQSQPFFFTEFTNELIFLDDLLQFDRMSPIIAEVIAIGNCSSLSFHKFFKSVFSCFQPIFLTFWSFGIDLGADDKFI